MGPGVQRGATEQTRVGMSYNRTTARPAIVTQVRSLIDQGIPYFLGGGHGWQPGQPRPWSFDCSGFTYYNFLFLLGINLNDPQGYTTSEIQWEQAVGGVVRDFPDVQLGALVYFMDFQFPNPGHVGVVTSLNKSGGGTYVSAYDSEEGIIEEPWTWEAGTFWGVTDPIMTLPSAPTPSPMEEEMYLSTDPNNGDAILVGIEGWCGIGATELAWWKNTVKLSSVPAPPASVFATWKKLR